MGDWATHFTLDLKLGIRWEEAIIIWWKVCGPNKIAVWQKCGTNVLKVVQNQLVAFTCDAARSKKCKKTRGRVDVHLSDYLATKSDLMWKEQPSTWARRQIYGENFEDAFLSFHFSPFQLQR